MITADLVSYIRKQQERNIPKFLIISKLVKAGWIEEDIEEGFEKIENERKEDSAKTTAETKSFEIKAKEGESFSDKYREPVGEGEPLAKIEIPIIKKEELAIKEVEKTEEPKTEEKREEIKIEEKKEPLNTSIEFQELELTQGQKETEKQKVWIPMSVPVKEVSEPTKEDSIVVESKELPKQEEETEKIVEPHAVAPLEQLIKEEELSAKVDSVVDEFVKTEIPELKEEPKRDYSLDNLPKIAVLTTYPKDILKIKTDMEEDAKQGTVFDPAPKKKISKWMIIIPILVIILGAGV